MDIGLALSILGLLLAVVLVHPQQARDAVSAWLRRITPKARGSIEPQALTALVGLGDIEVGNQFLASPLKRDRLKARYEDVWLEYPHAHQGVLCDLLEQERARARREGRTLDNNLGVLTSPHRSGPAADASGKRSNVYTLVLYPSDYEHFVVPNTILDRELTDSRTQERTTLRAMLGLQRDVLTLDGLERFPFHFRVGTELCSRHRMITGF
jgi:hypothetical protein